MEGDGHIKILITDDHPLFRQSLRMFLQTRAGLQIVGEAENGQVAVAKACELCPDVVLMDVSMPVLGGADATRQIKDVCRETVVIALSNQTEEYYVQQMKNAGAEEYLAKSTSPGKIESCIRAAVIKKK